MMIELYYAPISCSLVPYVALTEAGAAFTVKPVNFSKGMHLSDEYLKMNPKHTVPVLVVDGEPLTENVAILQWIAEQFPDARLLPASGPDKFRTISFLAWCASGIHPFLTPNILPQRYCDIPGSEEGVRRCAHKNLIEKITMADHLLTGREWFFESFSLADIYFFWCFRRARQFNVDVGAFANCGRHFERLMQRQSVQQLLAFEASVLAEFQKAA